MQRQRLGRNVAQLVDPPTVRRPEVVPLTTDEVRRLLAGARSMPNVPRWSVALALAFGRARRWV